MVCARVEDMWNVDILSDVGKALALYIIEVKNEETFSGSANLCIRPAAVVDSTACDK